MKNRGDKFYLESLFNDLDEFGKWQVLYLARFFVFRSRFTILNSLPTWIVVDICNLAAAIRFTITDFWNTVLAAFGFGIRRE